MEFKNFLKFVESKNVLLVFLMILVVIVIIDCNTKMFSNMIEGNTNGNSNSSLMAKDACPERSTRCGGGCDVPQGNPKSEAEKQCNPSAANINGVY